MKRVLQREAGREPLPPEGPFGVTPAYDQYYPEAHRLSFKMDHVEYNSDLVQALSAEAFELRRVPHDHVHRPLGKEELVQPVVGDLGQSNCTAKKNKG